VRVKSAVFLNSFDMTGAQAGRAIIRRRIKKSELNGDRLIFFMVFSPSYLLLSILSRLWGKVNRANPVFFMQKFPIWRGLISPSTHLLDEWVGCDYFKNNDFGGSKPWHNVEQKSQRK